MPTIHIGDKSGQSQWAINSGVKKKKKKGRKPPAQNYADPFGLVAAKLNAAKYISFDAELGRYKVVTK